MNEHQKKHLNVHCGILTSKTWLAEQDCVCGGKV